MAQVHRRIHCWTNRSSIDVLVQISLDCWQVQYRLLPFRRYGRRDRIHISMRYLDRFHTCPLACVGLYINRGHHCCDLSSGTEQSYRTQVFRILWVLPGSLDSMHSLNWICFQTLRVLRMWARLQHLRLFSSHFSSQSPFIFPFSWANEICADDDQERGIVLASMK